MPSSDPQTHEKAERKGHPAATAEQLLAAMLPYGFRDLVDQTFVSPMRHQSEGLFVPELLRAVITPDQIRRLFTLWACLKLSGGHEIHEWHLTTFEFVSSPEEGEDYAVIRQMTRAAEKDFTGLHACVFPDGDVSFYVTHISSGPVFASSVMSLTQFGNLGNR